MRIVLCLVVFALALLFTTPSASAAPVDALTESQYEYLFSRWATTHRKQYRAGDFFARYSTFKANLDLIRTHNANPSASYTMAINRFGDLTLAEFKAQLGVRTSKIDSGTRISAPSNSAQNSSGDKTVGRDSRCKTASPNRNGPRTLSRRDWREQGAVAPIRDQADCLSSGYAFAAVAAIEGEIAVQTGSFVPLSVAQPIDCSAEYGNHGCQGGHITAVLEYTLDRGLCPWSEYPEPDIRSKIPATAKIHGWNGDSTALGRDESNAKCACVAAARPWCYQSFRVRSVNDVLADAERTVLASGIAVTDGVRFYSSGVYDGEGCGEEPEQSVAVVGYDTDAEKPFYILRNSWGVGWGEEGYMRLALEEGKNTCGILTHTAYAEL